MALPVFFFSQCDHDPTPACGACRTKAWAEFAEYERTHRRDRGFVARVFGWVRSAVGVS